MTEAGPGPALVARMLSDALGESIEVQRVERLAPWFVARVHLKDPGPTRPSSVVVKWLREHPDDFRTDPRQLLTERTSLEFLDEANLHVAPRLLACDDAVGLLVLEDLAPRVALFDLLAAGDQRALAGLHAFARTMAELHAATAGRAHEYYDRRRSFGDLDPGHDRRHIDGTSWSWTLADLTAIGVDASPGAETEMRDVRDILLEDGSFIALSNGDAGANNFFVDGDDGRIIDWEFGGYRHALIDAASLYVPGPMWMTVADPTTNGVDHAYRTALAHGVAEAMDDDAFGSAMAGACFVKALERLDRLPKLEARPAGHESRAQIVATLDAAVGTAAHFRCLPHLADWVDTIAVTLRRRWPDADREFPDGYSTRE